MKKHLTIASLLVAGSAFVNAAIVETTKIADMDTLVAITTNNGVTTSSQWSYENGSVYDFSAENAYFSNGDASLLTTTSGYLTIGAWVYFDELGKDSYTNTVFGWGEDGKGFKFNVKNGGQGGTDSATGEFAFVTKWKQQALSSSFATSNFNDGWHYVAVSFNMNGGTDGAFFLDGESKGTFTCTAWDVPATSNTFAIGSQNGNAYSEAFKGLMAGLTLYASNSVLNAETVTSLMGAAPIPEPSAFGLLAGLGALALVGTRRRRR